MKTGASSLIRSGSTAALAVWLGSLASTAFAAAQGIIFIDVGGGTSEARWEIGGVQQGIAQQLQQVNPCSLVTTADLVSFESANAPSGVASAKQDGLGIDEVNGNGTNCAGIDVKGNIKEGLVVALGPRMTSTPPAAGDLNFFKLVLQLELKGARVTTFVTARDNGTPTGTWEIRGGATVLGTGRDPADFADPNPIVDCLEGGTDVAPDARDTCVVSMLAFGDEFVIQADEGSTTLEGGRSVAGFSEIHLTNATGLYDCGDTISATSLTQGGLEIASASCRRLEENLINCPTSTECVAVPALIEFQNSGYDLILEYDEGDQCVAVQCQIAFAPFDLKSVIPDDPPAMLGQRVTTPITLSPTDTYPLAGIETTYVPPPVVQFEPADAEFYLQHCLEPLRFHTAVDIDILSVTTPTEPAFAAGEIITNLAGTVQAKVISFQLIDGVATLVYFPEGSDFSDGDTLIGANATATFNASTARNSTFIRDLFGSTPAAPDAGFVLNDYSLKPNSQGIQHACLRSYELQNFGVDPTSFMPSADYIQALIDAYLQGDIRFAILR